VLLPSHEGSAQHCHGALSVHPDLWTLHGPFGYAANEFEEQAILTVPSEVSANGDEGGADFQHSIPGQELLSNMPLLRFRGGIWQVPR
jgi:hypothetical protein